MRVKVYNTCWWGPQSAVVRRNDGETDEQYLMRCGFTAEAKVGDKWNDENFTYCVEDGDPQ